MQDHLKRTLLFKTHTDSVKLSMSVFCSTLYPKLRNLYILIHQRYVHTIIYWYMMKYFLKNTKNYIYPYLNLWMVMLMGLDLETWLGDLKNQT